MRTIEEITEEASMLCAKQTDDFVVENARLLETHQLCVFQIPASGTYQTMVAMIPKPLVGNINAEQSKEYPHRLIRIQFQSTQ